MKDKILLADDDGAVRRSLAGVLESEGFDVLTAEGGREAVREFVVEPPDLVLLDVGMPGKNGWEVLDVIERFQPFIPVIIITARANQYERAVVSGVDALMEKPLDLPLLVDTIRRLLDEPESARRARLSSATFVPARLSRDESTPVPPSVTTSSGKGVW